MEFKYRAFQRKPTTMSYHPQSIIPYPSNSSLQGACGHSGYPTNPFGVPAVGDDTRWREMEKDQIRRELIADEIEIARRKREFEEEVRMELAVKRIQRYLAAPAHAPAPYSFEERVNPIAFDDIDNNFIRVSQPSLLNMVSPLEIKPSSPLIQNQKDKIIMLPRPKLGPALLCAKRKAVTPTIYDTEASGSGLSKKARKEWRCTLCEVNATSQKHLNKHLRGKKHKAKEAGDGTDQMIGLDAKGYRNSAQPHLALKELNQDMVEAGNSKNEAQLVQKIHNVSDLKNKTERDTKEAGKTKVSAARKKVSLWCKVCKVRAFSQDVMKVHKKGKKHLKEMMKFSQKKQ